MALSSEVQEFIRMANVQEREERKLQDMKDEKAVAQSIVAEKNAQIDAQQIIVQAGRAAIKAAAAAL